MNLLTDPPPCECRICKAPLAQRSRRGRPAEYCSRACRQAAYRRRREEAQTARDGFPLSPRTQSPPEPSPEDQALLELAKTARSALTQLIRELTPQQHTHTHGTVVRAPVTSAAKILEQVETLLAGTVWRARHHDTPWETIANLLGTSPETARRTYRDQAVRRRFAALGHTMTDKHTPPPPTEDSPPDDQAVYSPARSQLAPILSRLQRDARIPLRQLGERTRVSASYLSRILAGERFPSWELTERLGRTLGVDLCTLRQIWDAEHRRMTTHKLRRTASTSPSSGHPTPHTDLTTALRALIQRCGSPTLTSIATVIGHTLTPAQLAATLAGTFVPDWPRTERLVRALQGDPDSFRPLWQHAAADAAYLPPPPPAPHHPCSATPHNRLESLFAAFGPTLSTPAPAFGHM
ncbi:helix-turn-helix domain-containing protein [Streptomyces spirodelae]|uniref:Helix-turn-helix transcriptional regulator n=1 Tax=Streptomyces spirodelae TaxID=2812904 RepID=A0ABS3X1Q0_9ACTN|nr:helix-turn-helix transcriptional regulator [Streptomyces spirodelae]MBO8189249.1 helix-turn-helix transcriptional regulator [Streptomyces spirodelae]